MLTRFKASGYRNINAEVELGPCTVLVGPNNCGKSNLMRAIGMAADAARTQGEPNWDSVLGNHGGPGLIARSQEPWDIDVALHWSGTFAPFEAEFGLTCDNVISKHLNVSAETISLSRSWSRSNIERRGSTVSATWSNDDIPSDCGEASVEADCHPLLAVLPDQLQPLRFGIHMLRTHLASWKHVSVAALSPRKIATAFARPSTSELSPDAENLVGWLHSLENEHPEGLTSVVEALQPVLPGLKRLWIQSAETSGATWLDLVLGKEVVPLRDVSDGTIVAILLASLLHGPKHTGLLMLDEPELNLHPAWQRVVARWLVRPTSAEQVVVSTHSTDFLDALTPPFLEGSVTILVATPDGDFKNLKPETVRTFIEEGYELGDLYRQGDPVFGGWPW